MPQRLQRKRSKGWRKPEGAVCVTRPGRFSNPYRVGAPHPEHGWPMSAAEAVALFERDLRAGRLAVSVDDVRRELRGKDLLCWCPEGKACHADVLLRVSNEDI